MPTPPYSPARIEITIRLPSYDGRYWGRYPNGDKPTGLAGGPSIAVVGGGGLITRPVLAGAPSGVVSATGTLSGGSGATKANPSYASYLIGGNRFGGSPSNGYDSTGYNAYVKNLRSHIMGWFPGWDGFAIIPMATICQNQIANPVGTRNFLYHDPFFQSTGWKTEYVNAFTNNRWYLYQNFNTVPGTLVTAGTNVHVCNVTPGGPVVGGRTGNQYAIDYVLDYLMNGAAAGLAQSGTYVANNYIHGFYCDDLQPGANFSGGASVNGDFQRNGGTNDYAYPNGTTQVGIRTGFLQIINGWKTQGRYPVLGGGNGGGVGYNTSLAIPPEYAGAWDLNIFENAVGGGAGSFSNPGIGGSFNNSKAQYGRIASSLKTTGQTYLCYCGNNVRADGSDMQSWTSGGGPVWSPAWQGVRYQWGNCFVLGNGDYFCGATDPASSGGQGEPYAVQLRRWFDWFAWNSSGTALSQANAAPALTGAGCLGAWIDPPQTSATQNGCYRRRAQFGEAWVCPQGNGNQTVTPSKPSKYIASGQDPLYNGANIGATMPLLDRDGRIAVYL